MMLSSVIPKRSTSDDAEGVPCGTSEMFRTYASSRVLSIAIEPRPSRKSQTRAERRRGQRPQPCGTHGRSAAESVDAAEHRYTIHARWASDLRQPGGEIRPTI